MRTPPPDLAEAQVAATVRAGWAITADTVRYAPVGFGSHHWVLADTTGRSWFVTVDAVADDERRLAGLTAALATAHALRHRCGLTIVVAPVSRPDGGLLTTTGRYAIAVFPFVHRGSDVPADRQQILDMLVALHAAGPDLGAAPPREDLAIADRAALEAVLDGHRPGAGAGPYARGFGELVLAHEEPIRAALGRHQRLAITVAAAPEDWVVTHGEPKPNNTIVTTAGPVLVDWDTVRIAPPARDVWMTGSAADYARATGRAVSVDQLRFYRLGWDLKDLCTYAHWLTGPHERTADTERAWRGSVAVCRRLGVRPASARRA
jgi:hypothetical protein